MTSTRSPGMMKPDSPADGLTATLIARNPGRIAAANSLRSPGAIKIFCESGRPAGSATGAMRPIIAARDRPRTSQAGSMAVVGQRCQRTSASASRAPAAMGRAVTMISAIAILSAALGAEFPRAQPCAPRKVNPARPSARASRSALRCTERPTGFVRIIARRPSHERQK